MSLSRRVVEVKGAWCLVFEGRRGLNGCQARERRLQVRRGKKPRCGVAPLLHHLPHAVWAMRHHLLFPPPIASLLCLRRGTTLAFLD